MNKSLLLAICFLMACTPRENTPDGAPSGASSGASKSVAADSQSATVIVSTKPSAEEQKECPPGSQILISNGVETCLGPGVNENNASAEVDFPVEEAMIKIMAYSCQGANSSWKGSVVFEGGAIGKASIDFDLKDSSAPFHFSTPLKVSEGLGNGQGHFLVELSKDGVGGARLSFKGRVNLDIPAGTKLYSLERVVNVTQGPIEYCK